MLNCPYSLTQPEHSDLKQSATCLIYSKLHPLLSFNILIESTAKHPLIYTELYGFCGGSGGKESACKLGDLGSIPQLGRSPGERNGTHSSALAWKIPWTEEPGRLQSLSPTDPWNHKKKKKERKKKHKIRHTVNISRLGHTQK